MKHLRRWLLEVVSLAISGGIAWWVIFRDGFLMVEPWLVGSRASLYPTLVSLIGVLLGFVFTVLSVVVATISSPSLVRLRASDDYEFFWTGFTRGIRILAVCLAMSVAALVVDGGTAPSRTAFTLAVVAVIVATFQMIRCVGALEGVAMKVGQPRTKSKKSQARINLGGGS